VCGRSTRSLDGTANQMTLAELERLPLHDATLCSIEVLWREGRCRFHLELASGNHVLELVGITRVEVPHEAPWGPSVSVNRLTSQNGIVAVEMQSGDTIQVSAREGTFSAI